MTHILKTILGHVLLNYDIKLEDGAGGVRPKDMWLGSNCLPNSKAKLMFRKRADEARSCDSSLNPWPIR
jgi:hypothetical protein